MKIPMLTPSSRSREYNNFSEALRDKIIYMWLFLEEYSHRDLDKEVLNLAPEYSKGYQSMGILHHLGIKKDHKAIFKEKTIDEAIDIMTKQDEEHFENIIEALKRYNGDPVQRRVFYSWEILSNAVALKTIDKSVFAHRGTAIPIETRQFFEIDNMTRGERRNINLIYNGTIYDAHFEYEKYKTARTRLFWTSAFGEIVKRELFNYSNLFKKVQSDSRPETPKIRFEKKDSYNFIVDFIIVEDIEEDIVSELEESYFDYNEARTEGKIKYSYGKKYERDSKNRVDAIAFHGTKCKICEFDFEKIYGIRGKGYIEIHHINPLSNVGEEVKIDPKTDLIPVCANCHRMIHRRKDNILSINEMKELVEK